MGSLTKSLVKEGKASGSKNPYIYSRNVKLAIMWASKNKSVDLTHFESKSSGIDSSDEIISSERSSHTSGDTKDTEDANPDSIALIGSGDFGRALALRMVQSGLTVNIGSRNPQRNRELVLKTGAKLTSVEEAIRASQSNIVILAVPKDFYEKQPIHLFEGKVVIDVSNRNSIYAKGESQAEYLQSVLPRSAVVKAFNVLSAYALESGGIQGSKEVFYAGDVHSAKEEVSGLIRTLGFSPIDRGALRNAREIEDIPVQRSPLWKTPLIISTVLFAVLFLLSFSKMQICWTLTWDSWKGWHWGRFETIPVTTVNSTLAVHAITLLALCYLPGCIGAWIQIFRGTKYSRFPNWLDKWLKMRKQLGLLMLFSASLHMCLSVAMMSPTQYELAYGDPGSESVDITNVDVKKKIGWTGFEILQNQTVKVFGTEKMNLRGECFLLAGVMAYALAIVLGITSLPSVTNVLTWKEFGFVQSKLGWICLLFACAHDMFYGWPYIGSPSCYVPPTFQYALYIPGLAILMKIPMVLDDWLQIGYLNKIRGGWERNGKWGTGSKVDSEAGNAPVKQLDDPLGNDNKAYTVDPPAGLYPSIEVA